MPEMTRVGGVGDAELQADWTALLDRDGDATVFQGPRFLGVWADRLGTELDVTTAFHRDDDGELTGLVVEAVGDEDGTATWRFGGGTEVTDYTGPVVADGARDDFVAAWLPGALDRPVERHVLGGLPVDTGWPDDLQAALKAAGHDVVREHEDVCPVIDVADGHDAYLASLPGKLRQEQRRKTRKLVRDVGQVSLDQVGVDDLERGLETFFGMQADAAGPKASFFERAAMREFFLALADEFARDDVFRLHELSIGDRPVAATVSLVAQGRWGLYNSAFDPALGSFAPGMVLKSELVQHAAEEGLATFDLLRGDEPYKYRFGAVDRDLVRLSTA